MSSRSEVARRCFGGRGVVSRLASLAVPTSLLVVVPILSTQAPAEAAATPWTPPAAKVSVLDSSVGAKQYKDALDRWASQQAASAALIDGDAATTVTPRTAAAGTTSSSDGSGTYTATPLAPSSTWTAGGSSGSFDWSYPFTIPGAAAGPAPQLAINYDSGSVDGRTAITNNQTSVVGEGFDLTQSYIERNYLDCDQDGLNGKHDLCWHGEQLNLVLDGHSNPLVPTGANTFRLASDDGSIVKRLTGATNGDNDGEYWKLTTSDGTVYTFGINHLPGWTAGDPTTNSAWTVPVYANDSSDPAEAQTCAGGANWCQQGWRWNLDMVEDLHNNAETYWYTAETNRYARAGNTGADYERGGFLRDIDYGLRSGNLFDNTGSATDKTAAPYQVSLAYAERCIGTSANPCPDNLTSDTKSRWPDVPFSSICDSGDCGNNGAPTFFTRKRLATVTTQVDDSNGYRNIDRWALDQSWYDPGDLTGPFDHVLWLDSIQHTGFGTEGSSTQTAPVKLLYSSNSMENRVDTTGDGIAPLARPRLETIINEVGGVTNVDYSSVQCDPNNLPSTTAQIADNNQRCFPVYWTPTYGDPTLDWFNKYVVNSVSNDDTTTGDTVITSYDYNGGAGWKYNDDPQVANKYRTWSDWRGYSEVDTLVGRPDEQRSLTANYYFRGMNGNRDPSGGTTNVQIDGLDAATVTDKDQFGGLAYETVVYNGEGSDGTKGAKLSETIATPWTSDSTASTQIPGGKIGGNDADSVTIDAYMVNTKTTTSRTYINGSLFTNADSRSTTTQVLGFDSDGMPTQVETYATPDDASPGTHTDPTCTSYSYARNPSINLLTPVARTLVQSVSCVNAASAPLPADASTPGSVISDTFTQYDGASDWSNQIPTQGDATSVDRSVGYNSRTPVLQDRPVSTASYDALGRVTSTADADGNTTKTDYTPAGAGVPSSTMVTNALGQTTSTTWEPGRMQALTITDANGKTVEETYDDLGRLTAVWNASVSRAQGQAASEKFTYHFGGQTNSDGSVTGSWIDTQTPKGGSLTGYNDSYEVYDALMRTRQTQTPSPHGGQILTDTEFDDRGNVATNFTDAWDDSDTPNGTRYVVAYGGADQTDNTYDGADRLTKVVESWTVPTAGQCTADSTRCSRTTTTSYTGDSTLTVPPSGSTASATVTDALGRTTRSVVFPARDISTLTGSMKSVTSYDDQGRIESVTGNDGLATTYTYDLLGHTVSSTDPAAGTTATSYDHLDQITSTTDARQRTLSYTYDALGRKTGKYSGTDTANQANELASWTYDATGQLGQLSSSTRYVGGNGQPGTLAYTEKVNKYDSLYRPTSTTITLPAGDPLVTGAKLPTTYTTTKSYNRDGSLNTITDPAVAGLPAETETYGYDSKGLGLQDSLDGIQGVVLNTGYTALGDPQTLNLGISGTNSNQVSFTYGYDGLRRLASFETKDPASTGSHLINAAYAYNNANQITRVFDTAGAGNAEYHCYSYGDFNRLVTDWTPTTKSCATSTRTSSTIGGAAPYWKSYTYVAGAEGQRAKRVDHAFGSKAAKEWTYTYGAASCSGVAQDARQLTSVTYVSGTTNTTSTYCSDEAGDQTTSATSTGSKRTAAWDDEGHFARYSQVKGTSTVSYDYLYDADGNLLVKRPADDAAGLTTLYLGDTEIRATKNSDGTWALKGLRYYTDNAAGTVAVRTGIPGQTSALTFIAADPQGTTEAEWSATSPGATRTKRYTDAFGVPVTSPSWPDNKRFLGKTWDSTVGLSDLGARQYDPQVGRFLSVDPVLDAADPGSLDEYAYSDDNPVNLADPTGQYPICDGPDGLVMQCTAVQYPHYTTAHIPNGVAPTQPSPMPVSPPAPPSCGLMCHMGHAGSSVASFTRDAVVSTAEAPYHAVHGYLQTLVSAESGLATLGQPPTPANQVLAAEANQGMQEGMAESGSANVTLATLVLGDGAGDGVTALLGRRAAQKWATDDAVSLAGKRAQQLQATLPEGSRGRVTMGVGVGRDAEGGLRTVVGTSEPRGYLRPGVTLNLGEEMAAGGGHAEASIIDYMGANGIQPLTIGAGRPICPACASLLEELGILPASPLKVP